MITQPIQPETRRGSILLLVLVVVMLLSFSLYSFSELSLVQYQAARTSLQEMQLRQAAESGIVAATDFVQNRSRPARSLTGNRSGVRQQLRSHAEVAAESLDDFRYSKNPLQDIVVSSDDYGRTVCSVVKAVPQPGTPWQYGLVDDSARLNVNGLDLDPGKRRTTLHRLMQIPLMTRQTAAAILDWMDADDKPSNDGAESSFYANQNPSYRPRQSRFVQFHELLLVRGVTRQLLYGEDLNGDGIFQAREDQNGDGILQAGWSEFLTIESAERTLKPNGEAKINLNSNNLARLFDQLEELFGKDVATYIVAYRIAGREEPVDPHSELSESDKLEERNATFDQRLVEQLGSGDDENSDEFDFGDDDFGDDDFANDDLETGGDSSESSSPDASGNDGHSTSGETSPSDLSAKGSGHSFVTHERNGLSLPPTGPHRVGSLADVIGGMVRITINTEDRLLKSPWRDDAKSVRDALKQLSPHVALTGRKRMQNRINVYEAPIEVLMTVPGMTESMARSIRNSSQVLQARSLSSQGSSGQPSFADLIDRGIMNLATLRRLAPYLTVQGDVFRGVAVGQISNENRILGIRFAIDGTQTPPRVFRVQDLPPMPILNSADHVRSQPFHRNRR